MIRTQEDALMFDRYCYLAITETPEIWSNIKYGTGPLDRDQIITAEMTFRPEDGDMEEAHLDGKSYLLRYYIRKAMFTIENIDDLNERLEFFDGVLRMARVEKSFEAFVLSRHYAAKYPGEEDEE